MPCLGFEPQSHHSRGLLLCRQPDSGREQGSAEPEHGPVQPGDSNNEQGFPVAGDTCRLHHKPRHISVARPSLEPLNHEAWACITTLGKLTNSSLQRLLRGLIWLALTTYLQGPYPSTRWGNLTILCSARSAACVSITGSACLQDNQLPHQTHHICSHRRILPPLSASLYPDADHLPLQSSSPPPVKSAAAQRAQVQKQQEIHLWQSSFWTRRDRNSLQGTEHAIPKVRQGQLPVQCLLMAPLCFWSCNASQRNQTWKLHSKVSRPRLEAAACSTCWVKSHLLQGVCLACNGSHSNLKCPTALALSDVSRARCELGSALQRAEPD